MALNSRLGKRIRSFEELLGIHITLNDLSGSFAHLVDPSNLFHDHPFCLWVKSRLDGRRLCGDFDNGVAVRALGKRKSGFVKHCHGGVAEISLPLIRSGVLVGYMAAGPYRWMFDTPLPADAVRISTRTEFVSAPAALLRALPALDSLSVDPQLEVLSALADSIGAAAERTDTVQINDRNRRHLIEFYLGKEFYRNLELKDLAGFINLSPSRTGKVVHELFGKPFTRVLQEVRITHARNLLEHSLLSVSAIASQCGFPNQNYLYRLFRRFENVTPLEYRRRTQRELQI